MAVAGRGPSVSSVSRKASCHPKQVVSNLQEELRQREREWAVRQEAKKREAARRTAAAQAAAAARFEEEQAMLAQIVSPAPSCCSP